MNKFELTWRILLHIDDARPVPLPLRIDGSQQERTDDCLHELITNGYVEAMIMEGEPIKVIQLTPRGRELLQFYSSRRN